MSDEELLYETDDGRVMLHGKSAPTEAAPRTAAGRALLACLEPDIGGDWGRRILAIEAEAAQSADGLRAALDELEAQAGVIADGPSYDRLLRWIASRRAALSAEPQMDQDWRSTGAAQPEPPATALDVERLNHARQAANEQTSAYEWPHNGWLRAFFAAYLAALTSASSEAEGLSAEPPATALDVIAEIVKRHTHQGIWAMTRFAGPDPENDCRLCRALVDAGILTIDQIGAGTAATYATPDASDD